MVAMGTGAKDVTKYISIILPNVIMKMQITSAHMVIPTKRDWNHRPNSGPRSISISRASRSAVTLEMSIAVSPMITPEALFTMPCATSKTPITISHVLVTMRMAQADLKIHLKNTALSMSWKLFLSTMSWISSKVITKARMTPAMGTMTVSERFWTMLKISWFHAWGVSPTCVETSPTF